MDPETDWEAELEERCNIGETIYGIKAERSVCRLAIDPDQYIEWDEE